MYKEGHEGILSCYLGTNDNHHSATPEFSLHITPARSVPTLMSSWRINGQIFLASSGEMI